jgi:exonuclease III
MENNLKIVSWNCHCGLKMEKYLEIRGYSPHILIIQECTKNDFDYIKNMWQYKNWYNDDLKNNKSEIGVAIFSDYEIAFTEIFNRKFRYVIPYVVSKNDYKFTLFAVWINPIKGNYIDHFDEAVKYYRDNKMLDDNSIIIGDYNTFAKDDNGELDKLEGKLNPLINCTIGTDFRQKPTYYHAKNNLGIDDFCFIGKNIAEKFKIGINIPNKWDDKQDKDHHWKGLSDHAPIIVEFNPK